MDYTGSPEVHGSHHIVAPALDISMVYASDSLSHAPNPHSYFPESHVMQLGREKYEAFQLNSTFREPTAWERPGLEYTDAQSKILSQHMGLYLQNAATWESEGV